MAEKYLDKRIQEAEEIVEEAKKKLRQVIKEVQSNCSHENIGECKFEPGTLDRMRTPTTRVCLKCGLAEKENLKELDITPICLLTREEAISLTRRA